MNFKYTPNNLKKLEQILEEANYILRYEKGHFNSGFCILEDRKIIVINRFLTIEGRMNVLLEIIPSLTIDEKDLSSDLIVFYQNILKNTLA